MAVAGSGGEQQRKNGARFRNAEGLVESVRLYTDAAPLFAA